MPLLTGLTPDGLEVPVQVKPDGKLVAEGLTGPAGGVGPQGPAGPLNGAGALGGTPAAPSLTSVHDTISGVYSGGAGKVGLATFGRAALEVDGFSANITVWEGDIHLANNKGLKFLNKSGTVHYPGIKLDLDDNLVINQNVLNNAIVFGGGAGERVRIDKDSRLLVGANVHSGDALLQVNGDRIRVATPKTPASATDTGTAGEACWDADYIYVCTATNTWKRTAISAW